MVCGLKVPAGDRVVKVSATTDPKQSGPCDLVIVATKAMDTETAVRSALPMISSQSLVLTIQNGIGNGERMERLIGATNLFVGIAEGFGASIVKPGHVHHNGWEMIHLGELVGTITDRLRQLAAAWKAAGFNVSVHEDIRSVIWGKLICNIGFSAICTVTGLRIGQVLNNPDAWSVSKSCVLETVALAKAKHIKLPYDNPLAAVHEFGAKIPKARPSMLLDLDLGKPSEIDSLNGAVAREAEALGIPAPVNEVMTRLVKAMEDRRRTLGKPYGVV